MTIIQAIDRIDQRKEGNRVPPEEKLRWLSVLDQRVKTKIQGAAADTFSGYDTHTNTNDELAISSPFAEEIYDHWLGAKIELYHAEYARYNAEIELFNDALLEYERHWRATHDSAPLTPKYY